MWCVLLCLRTWGSSQVSCAGWEPPPPPHAALRSASSAPPWPRLSHSPAQKQPRGSVSDHAIGGWVGRMGGVWCMTSRDVEREREHTPKQNKHRTSHDTASTPELLLRQDYLTCDHYGSVSGCMFSISDHQKHHLSFRNYNHYVSESNMYTASQAFKAPSIINL